MPDQSIRLSFSNAGPGQAGEHAASLANWLNDTVVRAADTTDGAEPVKVELVAGNPNAQMDHDTIKLVLEAASHGVVAGAIAGTAHFAFDQAIKPTVSLLAKNIVRWWKSNGRPALQLAFSTEVRQIAEDCQDPEGEIAAALANATRTEQ